MFCGDSGHKIRLASEHLFQRLQQHGGCKKPLGNNKLMKK